MAGLWPNQVTSELVTAWAAMLGRSQIPASDKISLQLQSGWFKGQFSHKAGSNLENCTNGFCNQILDCRHLSKVTGGSQLALYLRYRVYCVCRWTVWMRERETLQCFEFPYQMQPAAVYAGLWSVISISWMFYMDEPLEQNSFLWSLLPYNNNQLGYGRSSGRAWSMLMQSNEPKISSHLSPNR